MNYEKELSAIRKEMVQLLVKVESLQIRAAEQRMTSWQASIEHDRPVRRPGVWSSPLDDIYLASGKALDSVGLLLNMERTKDEPDEGFRRRLTNYYRELRMQKKIQAGDLVEVIVDGCFNGFFYKGERFVVGCEIGDKCATPTFLGRVGAIIEKCHLKVIQKAGER